MRVDDCEFRSMYVNLCLILCVRVYVNESVRSNSSTTCSLFLVLLATRFGSSVVSGWHCLI